VAEQQGKEGVQKFRAARQADQEQAQKLLALSSRLRCRHHRCPDADIQTVAPRRRVAQVVSAAPVVQVPEPMPVAPESPLVGGHPGDLPPPVLDEAVEAPAPELLAASSAFDGILPSARSAAVGEVPAGLPRLRRGRAEEGHRGARQPGRFRGNRHRFRHLDNGSGGHDLGHSAARGNVWMVGVGAAVVRQREADDSARALGLLLICLTAARNF